MPLTSEIAIQGEATGWAQALTPTLAVSPVATPPCDGAFPCPGRTRAGRALRWSGAGFLWRCVGWWLRPVVPGCRKGPRRRAIVGLVHMADGAPIDPSWLPSTAAQSTAALVAIVGGFLINRLIGIDSERRQAEQRLVEARERRDAGKRDA